MALTQLTLTSVSKLKAEAKTTSGEVVYLGWRKSANIIMGLLDKPVGHVFTLDLEKSDQGRLYNTETLEVEKTYTEVSILRLRKRAAELTVAKFDE